MKTLIEIKGSLFIIFVCSVFLWGFIYPYLVIFVYHWGISSSMAILGFIIQGWTLYFAIVPHLVGCDDDENYLNKDRKLLPRPSYKPSIIEGMLAFLFNVKRCPKCNHILRKTEYDLGSMPFGRWALSGFECSNCDYKSLHKSVRYPI